MGQKFKVGDEVRVTGGDEELQGMVGTITHVKPHGYCVEFEGWEGGHSGDFNDGREDCWYLPENYLELVNSAKEEAEEDKCFNMVDPDSIPVHDLHYQTRIQPIETMQANMTPEEFQGFCKGNIIKYACRCGRKDEPLKEAEKIVDYAKWLVASLKGEIINPHCEEGGE